MKNKRLLIIVFSLITSITFSFILYKSNQDLFIEIGKRDELIKRTQLNDSLNCEHTIKYVNTITKYVTQDCGLLIDNKEISLDEFISIYSDEIDKKNKLRSEIFRVRDSNNILLRQLEIIKIKYSVRANTKKDGNHQVTSAESATIDSALILLPYFRDRLSYDSVKKEWIIRISK
jgi:hypothetical protein